MTPLDKFLSDAEKRLEAAGPNDCWEGFVRGNEYLLQDTKELFAHAPDTERRLLAIVKVLREGLEDCTGGDLASGEGIYKAEVALQALKRAEDIAHDK